MCSPPQRPTVHALDLDTGAVRLAEPGESDLLGGDASYGPTSGVPGVAIVGSVITPAPAPVRLPRTVALLVDRTIGNAGQFSGISSGAAVLDGTLVVGTGIGSRTRTGSSPGDFAAYDAVRRRGAVRRGAPGCR